MINNFFELMNFSKILESLNPIAFNINNEVVDLKTKEGLDKFNKYLDNIEKNEFSKLFLEQLTNKKISDLRTLAKNYFMNNQKSENPEKAKVDQSLREVKVERKQEKIEFDRPSKNIDVNVGLQIHKLVQEYIDTKIKPYAKGLMSEKSINDAYAGLYEFACWIYNKPSKKDVK